jgi:uncharacterized protein YdhG (YjbR/CyaY superfamily)
VQAYLAELSPERRAALEAVRKTILDNLPAGYEEAMNWGMIAYQVPLETYPDAYNGQPLMYAALASQKRHMAVYLTGVYMDPAAREAFEAAYGATGKRMDIGKSCVRFRRLDDLPLELVGESIRKFEVDEFVARVEEAHTGRKGKRSPSRRA